MLKLHVLGVGDAFTERYHNACLCIEDPGSGLRLQIDCPPAFPRVLADHRARTGSDLSAANIDHLLLTHLHGDHCGGTEAFLYLRRFVLQKKPTLYGAAEVLSELWPTRLRGGMERLLLGAPEYSPEQIAARFARSARTADRAPEYSPEQIAARLARSAGAASRAPETVDPGGAAPEPFIDSPAREREMIEAPGPLKQLGLLDYTDRVDLQAGVTRLGPLLIERRFTRHHIPTTAIRVSLDRGPGRSRPLLGYSADTAFDPDLIAWLAEAELIIHETNFGVHTPLASLLQLPAEVRARMRLIHYPDLLAPETAPIECLREGQILQLGD
ncbi:MAG TPA: MBL fold metallo-hydrolase [Pseudomonadota bacterium]|nr:MBL fold metallo-hydrolase [Pseudomonadota bacterium]